MGKKCIILSFMLHVRVLTVGIQRRLLYAKVKIKNDVAAVLKPGNFFGMISSLGD